MSDDVDRASERETIAREDALRDQARRAGLAGKTLNDSAQWCEDCGENISAKRRAAVPGCATCLVCQARRERQKKGFK